VILEKIAYIRSQGLKCLCVASELHLWFPYQSKIYQINLLLLPTLLTNSSILPSSFNICYTLPGLDRLSGLAAGSKMNYHTIVKMLKKVNIVKWSVSEFSTGLKSRQQESVTVAGTIGNFTFYDNFKI
jgi:hypothetical protein